MPDPIQPSGRLKGAALTALIVATVSAVAPVITEPNEGLRGGVYRDPAGYLTQCYGERQVDPSRIYSKDGCAAKLHVRMARDYGAAIIKCVPDFADPAHKLPFGASIDASYNAGPVGFCRSPMARAFNAGRWSEGCRTFPGWYVTSRRKLRPNEHPKPGGTLRVIGGVRYEVRRYPGLVRRRVEEMTYCLTGKQ